MGRREGDQMPLYCGFSSISGERRRITEEPSVEDADQQASNSFSLAAGTWVVVLYDGVRFPGEVTSVNGEDVEVNVMHRSGQSRWKI